MQGIYRLAGDNLIICYDSERGTLPATFAADKETEILLILRREHPRSTPANVPETRSAPQSDGFAGSHRAADGMRRGTAPLRRSVARPILEATAGLTRPGPGATHPRPRRLRTGNEGIRDESIAADGRPSSPWPRA